MIYPGVDPQVNQIGVSNGFGLDYFTNPMYTILFVYNRYQLLINNRN